MRGNLRPVLLPWSPSTLPRSSQAPVAGVLSAPIPKGNHLLCMVVSSILVLQAVLQ